MPPALILMSEMPRKRGCPANSGKENTWMVFRVQMRGQLHEFQKNLGDSLIYKSYESQILQRENFQTNHVLVQ